MGTKAADKAGIGFDIRRSRIDLAAIDAIGHEPGQHRHKGLPAAANAQPVALASAIDQQGPGGEGDQSPSQHPGAIRAPELRVDGVGDEGDGKAAEHQEAHDAEVEQPAISPLDIEAQRDQAIGRSLDEARRREGQAHRPADHQDQHEQACEQGEGPPDHDEAPLKIPVGRTSRTTTRMTKATVSLYSVGTSASVAGNCIHSGSTPLSGRSTMVQLNTASDSAKPISSPPAMAP